MRLAVYECRTGVIGGNQTYITLLMGQQAVPALQTTLIVPRDDKLSGMFGSQADVRVLASGRKRLGYLGRVLALARILRAMPSDTTLMCNNRTSAMVGLPAALLARRRSAWFVKASSRSGLSNYLLGLMCDRILLIAPQVFDLVPAFFRKRLLARSCPMPIGVELDRFLETAPPQESPELRVCVLSRLHAAKAPHLLLDALNLLGDDAEGIRIDLYGDTPEHQRAYAEGFMRRVAAEGRGRLVLHGWIGDVVPALEISDVVALPSRSEGFPRSLVEAMACARPVVATAVGGVCDLVEDGRTGCIIAVDDAAALARSLVWLRDHPQRRIAMGLAAREHVRAHFSLPAHLGQLDAVLAEIQGAAGRPS